MSTPPSQPEFQPHGSSVPPDGGAALPAGWSKIEALLDRDAAVTRAEAQPSADDLTRRTAERLAAYRAAARPAPLCEADGATLDALLVARAAGHEASAAPLPSGLSERRAGVADVLALLDRDGPTAGHVADEAPADLADRTMDAVRAARQRERFAQQIDMLREGPRSAGVSLRQIFSAAAILLLGATLLLPMLERSRANGLQQACLSNLFVAGQAFGQYAADHAGVFPRAASTPGASWWNVGRPDAVMPDGTVRSNSAHLFLLVRGGYVSPDKLACRGNANALRTGRVAAHEFDWSSPLAVSYSYQNQFTPRVLRADDARPSLAVLADKNPLFVPRGDRLVFDETARITDASRQHGGRGQNALRIDGAASWTIAPNFKPGDSGQPEADLFWAVGSKPADHRYTGRELPDGVASDAFLVP